MTPKMYKAEVLNLAKANKKPKSYVIDQLIQENGHEVLRLPPYHCQFNAIELIWADAKKYYNTHIGSEGNSDDKVLQMWEMALQKCIAETWKKCVQHTETIIKNWYDRANIIDEAPEIIIEVGNESSESNDDEDE